MKSLLVVAMAFLLWGCEDLPSEPSAVQEQQISQRFRAPGQPYQPAASSAESQGSREPVPGEIVPNR
jgi:hypothetical protein